MGSHIVGRDGRESLTPPEWHQNEWAIDLDALPADGDIGLPVEKARLNFYAVEPALRRQLLTFSLQLPIHQQLQGHSL